MIKKTFTNNDFGDPNNTAANTTASNNANNNAFGKKSLFLKIMHHLLQIVPIVLPIVLQRLMA